MPLHLKNIGRGNGRTSPWALTALVALLTGVLVAPQAGATTGTQAPTRGTKATLTVVITGLTPAGTNANVTVTGPRRFHRALTATTTLTGLVPGKYRVTAAPVISADGIASATPRPAALTLGRGKRGTSTVAYAFGPVDVVANPGAELGSPVGAVTDYKAYSTPGWVPAAVNSSGAVLPAAYNPYATLYAGGIDDALTASTPGPADRGKRYFAGGNGNTWSMLTQKADLSPFAARIDGGASTYQLSGWLGGWSSQTDAARVTVTFLNGSGQPLGTAVIGPVTVEDRAEVTGLFQRSASGAVPAGTRSASIEMKFGEQTGASFNDGYADNVHLLIG